MTHALLWYRRQNVPGVDECKDIDAAIRNAEAMIDEQTASPEAVELVNADGTVSVDDEFSHRMAIYREELNIIASARVPGAKRWSLWLRSPRGDWVRVRSSFERSAIDAARDRFEFLGDDRIQVAPYGELPISRFSAQEIIQLSRALGTDPNTVLGWTQPDG